MTSPSYDPDACCGSDCNWLDNEEPCWGKVSVVAEEWNDEDYWWIHACEGHIDVWDGGHYIEEP